MGNFRVVVGNGQTVTAIPKKLEVYLDLSQFSTPQKKSLAFSFKGLVDHLIMNISELSEYSGLTETEKFSELCDRIDSLLSDVGRYQHSIVIKQLALIFTDIDIEIISSLYNDYLSKINFNIEKLVNVTAIQNSLHQIFTWIPGERILNPEFGSNLRFYLYEQITNGNQNKIESEIRAAVTKWEPRVDIAGITRITTTDDVEMNTVGFDVVYRIKGLSDEQFHYSYIPQKTAV